jgi:hypothetical protein
VSCSSRREIPWPPGRSSSSQGFYCIVLCGKKRSEELRSFPPQNQLPVGYIQKTKHGQITGIPHWAPNFLSWDLANQSDTAISFLPFCRHTFFPLDSNTKRSEKTGRHDHLASYEARDKLLRTGALCPAEPAERTKDFYTVQLLVWFPTICEEVYVRKTLCVVRHEQIFRI